MLPTTYRRSGTCTMDKGMCIWCWGLLSNCNGGWTGKRDLDCYSGQLRGLSGRVMSFQFANMLWNHYNRRSATRPEQNNLPEGNCISGVKGSNGQAFDYQTCASLGLADTGAASRSVARSFGVIGVIAWIIVTAVFTTVAFLDPGEASRKSQFAHRCYRSDDSTTTTSYLKAQEDFRMPWSSEDLSYTFLATKHSVFLLMEPTILSRTRLSPSFLTASVLDPVPEIYRFCRLGFVVLFMIMCTFSTAHCLCPSSCSALSHSSREVP